MRKDNAGQARPWLLNIPPLLVTEAPFSGVVHFVADYETIAGFEGRVLAEQENPVVTVIEAGVVGDDATTTAVVDAVTEVLVADVVGDDAIRAPVLDAANVVRRNVRPLARVVADVIGNEKLTAARQRLRVDARTEAPTSNLVAPDSADQAVSRDLTEETVVTFDLEAHSCARYTNPVVDKVFKTSTVNDVVEYREVLGFVCKRPHVVEAGELAIRYVEVSTLGDVQGREQRREITDTGSQHAVTVEPNASNVEVRFLLDEYRVLGRRNRLAQDSHAAPCAGPGLVRYAAQARRADHEYARAEGYAPCAGVNRGLNSCGAIGSACRICPEVLNRNNLTQFKVYCLRNCAGPWSHIRD